MAGTPPPDETPRLIIRLIGLQPSASQDQMVNALQRIYRRRSADEIRRALARLPLVLSRSATEEQARKLRGFLESKGAILDIAHESPAPSPPPVQPTAAAPEGAEETPPLAEPIPSGVIGPSEGIERRAKPRVHPGIKLYPMGVGEILDRSFRLLRDHFWLFFIILLIPQAAAFLVGKVAQLFLFEKASQDMTLTVGVGLGVSTVLALVVFLVFQIWGQGALIHAVSETYLGHRTSVRGSYGAMRLRLWRLLFTLLLMWLFIGLPIGACGVLMAIIFPAFLGMGVSPAIAVLVGVIVIIPGVILFFRLFFHWLMADKVVVLEGQKGTSALRRSRELMKARTEPGFWKGPKMKASLILLVAFLIGIGIRLLFQIPGLLLQIFMPEQPFTVTLREALNVIAASLATTYWFIAMIVYYYDIRIRREGFDLKMMAHGL